ncbi:MAG: AraC family transcriptional regulator [Fibrobacterota bacterium]
MAKKAGWDLNLLSFPPRIIHANYFSFVPGQVVGPHWDNSNLFILVSEGKGIVRAARRDIQIREGMVCCIPWTLPVLYKADKNEPMKIATLHLEYRPWRKHIRHKTFHTRICRNSSCSTMETPPFPQPFPDIHVVSALTHSALFSLASRIIWVYDKKEIPNREALLRALAVLFVHEYGSVKNETMDESNVKVKGTAAFHELIYQLEFHYADPLTTRWLAERAHMSYSTLSVLFKKKTGVSPMEYVIQMRINRAQQLLRTSALSIKEIVKKVGISNQRYFSRLFRNRCGLSPSDYRKKE